MNIYIDESGVFKTAPHPNAWCVVAGYMVTEKNIRHLNKLMLTLKLNCGKTHKEEVKLRDLNENQYIDFLKDLNMLDGTLYATATDMSLINDSDVILHRNIQANKIIEHKDKMIYDSGKLALQDLFEQIIALSPQIYMQIICQINLIVDVINRGVLYYVQRSPKNLGHFKWRIDQKNTSKLDFETAFQRLSPPIIQSISINKPFISLKGADYSAMEKFTYTSESMPTYLSDSYGIEIPSNEAFNLGKILNSDFSFTDSKAEIGVQVSDLLASGMRRLLRGEFENQNLISKYMGRLLVSNYKHKPSINLISFTESTVTSESTERAINNMDKYAKAMVLDN